MGILTTLLHVVQIKSRAFSPEHPDHVSDETRPQSEDCAGDLEARISNATSCLVDEQETLANFRGFRFSIVLTHKTEKTGDVVIHSTELGLI